MTNRRTRLAGKRKWWRIVNCGYDHLPNSPVAAGIGGVALDELKEGLCTFAAGYSNFGGVIHEPNHNGVSKPHAPRENTDASNTHAKQTGSENLSTSSMSSIQESVHASDHIPDGRE